MYNMRVLIVDAWRASVCTNVYCTIVTVEFSEVWCLSAQLLADNHAELDCKNRAGDDAIQIAHEERQLDCVYFLAERLGVELNERGIHVPSASAAASVKSASTSSTPVASGSPFPSPRKQPPGAVAEAASGSSGWGSRGKRTAQVGGGAGASGLRFSSSDVVDVDHNKSRGREQKREAPVVIEETPVMAFVADEDIM
jgi:hypothetical protein